MSQNKDKQTRNKIDYDRPIQYHLQRQPFPEMGKSGQVQHCVARIARAAGKTATKFWEAQFSSPGRGESESVGYQRCLSLPQYTWWRLTVPRQTERGRESNLFGMGNSSTRLGDFSQMVTTINNIYIYI